MSEDKLEPIVGEILIEAPLLHVWEVMTAEASVKDWLGCINYRREVGATFHMQQDAGRRARGETEGATFCDVAVLEPPHRFEFTWYVPGTPKTLVRISLVEQGAGRTLVRLVHEGWEQFPAAMVKPFHDQLKSGWSGGVLPSLKRAAETA